MSKLESKMNTQRIAIAVSAGVGILSCFMPWAKLPIVGSISGASGDGVIYAVLLIVPLLIALLGDKRKELDKKAKIASALVGVLVLVMSFVNIATFNEKMGEAKREASRSIDSGSYSGYLNAESKKIAKSVSNSLAASASVEFGLYLLVLSSISLTGCSVINSLFKNDLDNAKKNKNS